MSIKLPEMMLGAVIVYLVMVPKKQAPAPLEAEEEVAEEKPPEKAARTIPYGFMTGLEEMPTGPPSLPPGPSRETLARIRRIDP